jgi:hypothetical protein
LKRGKPNREEIAANIKRLSQVREMIWI